MKRVGIFAALSLLLVALVAVPVLAVTNFENAPSGAHYRQGFAEPVCTVDQATDTVECTGTSIGGVGNTNADVNLSVEATADLTCTNRGGNLVEPHSTTVTDTEADVAFSARNGQITIDPIDEDVTESEVERAFTCPNRNWTEDVQDITITGFTYSVTFAGFDEPAILIEG